MPFAQNLSMSNNKTDQLKHDVCDQSVSANECTGLLQKITLDHEELERYHRQFNEEE